MWTELRPLLAGSHVWERGAVAFRIQLYSITDRGAVLRAVHKNAGDSAGCDVDNVIDWTASVRETSEIAGQKSQALLVCQPESEECLCSIAEDRQSVPHPSDRNPDRSELDTAPGSADQCAAEAPPECRSNRTPCASTGLRTKSAN